MLAYIAFALSGKVLIYLIQKFPLTLYISRYWKILRDLVECDLCLGVWVYSLLNLFAFRLTFYSDRSDWIGEIITGSAISFIMHLISIGWKEKFGVIFIGQEK